MEAEGITAEVVGALVVVLVVSLAALAETGMMPEGIRILYGHLDVA